MSIRAIALSFAVWSGTITSASPLRSGRTAYAPGIYFLASVRISAGVLSLAPSILILTDILLAAGVAVSLRLVRVSAAIIAHDYIFPLFISVFWLSSLSRLLLIRERRDSSASPLRVSFT